MNLLQLEIKNPRSLATCMQFTALWAGEQDRAQLVQLCAGAIGVCCAFDNAPFYRPSQGKPYDFGYAMLDFLLEKGATATQIYTKGSECLSTMASALPSEEEVQAKEDFFSPPGEE